MNGENILHRTKQFAIRIILMSAKLPQTYASQVIARQVTRSATSVGANYRAACRSKSRKDFINKLKIVEEELDETCYWLELIKEINIMPSDQTMALLKEGNELLAIIVKSIVTARKNIRNEE